MPDVQFKMTVIEGVPPVGGTFLATIDPPEQTVPKGTAAAYTVKFEAVDGFAGLIAVEVQGLPDGAVAGITPNPAAVTDTVSVTIETANVLPGTYDLVLKAVEAGTLSPSRKRQ